MINEPSTFYKRAMELSKQFYDLSAEQGLRLCPTRAIYEKWLDRTRVEAEALYMSFDPDKAREIAEQCKTAV